MEGMTDMEKCTTYTRNGDSCTIKCNLGMWEVTAQYGLGLIGEAYHYFEQYKADGEYHAILGGKCPADVLAEALTNVTKG